VRKVMQGRGTVYWASRAFHCATVLTSTMPLAERFQQFAVKYANFLLDPSELCRLQFNNTSESDLLAITL
jgi:hypothetical protein